ncbi:MAG: SDR family oxidoreductase [Candidatus Schmidhempelia sp.]|nr:SDR family oxidoreductase [Candidatus Schmidhempelia sp.]
MNIALVTGASSGFGEAICRRLIHDGYKVIGCARRFDKLYQLQQQLGEYFLPLLLDMTQQETIACLLDHIPESFQPIEILINNAGLALGLDAAYQTNFNDWQTMIETNILGLVHLTHLILPIMVKRNQGYIINIGSTAGTYAYKGGNVYGASKAFVKQFSLNLRTDLAGKRIRVTNIEPGLCGGTEFSTVRFHGDKAKADKVYDGIEYITAADIANTVSWLLSLPAHININSLEMMPVSQTPAGLNVTKIDR